MTTRSSKLNEIDVLSIALNNVLGLPWQLLIMMLSWVKLFLLLHIVTLRMLLPQMVYPRLGHVLILMEFFNGSLFAGPAILKGIGLIKYLSIMMDPCQ